MEAESFREQYSFQKRRNESMRIRSKYSDRIPVIVEKGKNSNIPEIDKKKYLVPSDLTVGQFLYVIRRRIHLSSEKAIFLFINGKLPSITQLMSTIYREHMDNDGFLYVTYRGENVFGINTVSFLT